MRLESDIDGAIYRLRRLPRDLREAAKRTLDPASWEAQLETTASTTLWALASQEEWRFVKPFLDTLMVHAPAPLSFSARMHRPASASLAVQRKLPGVGNGSFDAIPVGNKDQFAQLLAGVHEWVEREKHWDVVRDGPRDAQSVMDKADWITYLLISRNLTPEEQAARDALMPHVLEHLQQRATMAGQAIPRATASQWLNAVLAAWSAMVRRELGSRFRSHLAAVRKELN